MLEYKPWHGKLCCFIKEWISFRPSWLPVNLELVCVLAKCWTFGKIAYGYQSANKPMNRKLGGIRQLKLNLAALLPGTSGSIVDSAHICEDSGIRNTIPLNNSPETSVVIFDVV